MGFIGLLLEIWFLLSTASKRVLILRTWSLIRTFLAFWVLIGSLFIFQGRYFHYFGFIQAKLSHICKHWFWFTLLANFDFYLCLRINFHTSSFWVLILAAGGLLGILGTFGHFWAFLALLGTFAHSGHFWALWALLGIFVCSGHFDIFGQSGHL